MRIFKRFIRLFGINSNLHSLFVIYHHSSNKIPITKPHTPKSTNPHQTPPNPNHFKIIQNPKPPSHKTCLINPTKISQSHQSNHIKRFLIFFIQVIIQNLSSFPSCQQLHLIHYHQLAFQLIPSHLYKEWEFQGTQGTNAGRLVVVCQFIKRNVHSKKLVSLQ